MAIEVPEWLVRVWEPVAPYASRLAVWRGYEGELQTLAIYGVGIAAFTMLVFGFFCVYLSKRDPFAVKKGSGWSSRLERFAQGAVVFPAVSFMFFGVLAVALFLLAKSQSTEQILLLSMSVVVGVRLTSFVSETAASDLAKLLPLSLLGVLIVDPSYASLDRTWAHFGNVGGLLPLLGRYALLFIALELAMQVARGVWHRFEMSRGTLPKRPTKHQLIENARNVPVGGPGEAPLQRER